MCAEVLNGEEHYVEVSLSVSLYKYIEVFFSTSGTFFSALMCLSFFQINTSVFLINVTK